MIGKQKFIYMHKIHKLCILGNLENLRNQLNERIQPLHAILICLVPSQYECMAYNTPQMKEFKGHD